MILFEINVSEVVKIKLLKHEIMTTTTTTTVNI
jgi:hypothetical protein